jgi:hypothetical protein
MYKIKILHIVTTLCFFFLGCTKKLKPSEFHTFRINLLKDFQDPTAKNIPLKFIDIANKLRVVHYNDQLYRDVKNPKYHQQNLEKQNILDSINFKVVSSILDKYGYLGLDDVGYIASKAQIIVLVHAPYSFKIKYKKIIDSAMIQKKISGETYAMFVDKMALTEKRYQLYGTQVLEYQNSYTLYPTDLTTVDSLRKIIGLPMNVKTYLKNLFNTNFDSADYQKRLPDLEKVYQIGNH